MAGNKNIIMAAVSGVLLILGFPLFDLYPLAWIALVPLLMALRGKDPKVAFYIGLLAGFVYFGGTFYWVYHSMYHYGNLPLVLSIFLLLLLSFSQALYIGMFSLLFNFISRRSAVPAFVVVPMLWVTVEYIRTYTIFSFPWAVLGYSQYKFLSLIQVSDITGVYGISFLVAAFNGALYDTGLLWLDKSAESSVSRWMKRLSVPACLLFIAAALFYGTEALARIDTGKQLKVSVIQGNIPQDKKWDAKFQEEVINTYERLSTGALSFNPDIIIWPESALPFIFGYDKALTEEVVSFQRQLARYLIFGSVMVRDNNGNNKLSNSAILLSPEGTMLSVYDKIHLVPYGEYVPLSKLFPFVGKMVTAIGDFLPGEEITVMETPFARIGNLICYEIIFPGLVRQFVDKGANVLVTITNDAWFGRTSAPYQHFSMAVFRAIENRVPVARAANTGISGFIDSKGHVINKSDIFVEAALTQEITAGAEKSFYTKYGDVFVYMCIAGSVLLIGRKLFFERQQ